MAEILFFGTCSGTEPQPDMKHCAFAIKAGDLYYWFDAGEGCSRTAHLMGVDLLSVKAIFISHTHMDHVGGFGNLLWNIRKLTNVTGRNVPNGKISVVYPVMDSFNSIMSVLNYTEGGFKCKFDIEAKQTKDGLIYSDENVRISAYHNLHCKPTEDGQFTSYSYKIEVKGKTVVFSGDVFSVEELDDIIGDGCDHLIMETGHHSVAKVCEYANAKNVKKLWFNHHGREIINGREQATALAKSIKQDAIICFDQMRVQI